MSEWTHHRAKVASLSRLRTADDPELVTARQDLKACRLEQHIRAQVDSWPALTDEQLDRLATILRPAESAGGRR